MAIGPAESDIFKGIKEATQKYDRAVRSTEKGHSLGPPNIYAYLEVVKKLMLADVGGLNKGEMETFFPEDSAAEVPELAGRVRVFRMAKCFDKSKNKLIMAFHSCGSRRSVLRESLMQQGLVWMVGKAPAGGLEDEMEEFLSTIAP